MNLFTLLHRQLDGTLKTADLRPESRQLIRFPNAIRIEAVLNYLKKFPHIPRLLSLFFIAVRMFVFCLGGGEVCNIVTYKVSGNFFSVCLIRKSLSTSVRFQINSTIARQSGRALILVLNRVLSK